MLLPLYEHISPPAFHGGQRCRASKILSPFQKTLASYVYTVWPCLLREVVRNSSSSSSSSYLNVAESPNEWPKFCGCGRRVKILLDSRMRHLRKDYLVIFTYYLPVLLTTTSTSTIAWEEEEKLAVQQRTCRKRGGRRRKEGRKKLFSKLSPFSFSPS